MSDGRSQFPTRKRIYTFMLLLVYLQCPLFSHPVTLNPLTPLLPLSSPVTLLTLTPPPSFPQSPLFPLVTYLTLHPSPFPVLLPTCHGCHTHIFPIVLKLKSLFNCGFISLSHFFCLGHRPDIFKAVFFDNLKRTFFV